MDYANHIWAPFNKKFKPVLLLNLTVESFIVCKFIGNKAKGWISKWVFQENKACQIYLAGAQSHEISGHKLRYCFQNKSLS